MIVRRLPTHCRPRLPRTGLALNFYHSLVLLALSDLDYKPHLHTASVGL